MRSKILPSTTAIPVVKEAGIQCLTKGWKSSFKCTQIRLTINYSAQHLTEVLEEP